jgi:hypothetical protein
LEDHIDRLPFKDPADAERIAEGARKAGLLDWIVVVQEAAPVIAPERIPKEAAKAPKKKIKAAARKLQRPLDRCASSK